MTLTERRSDDAPEAGLDAPAPGVDSILTHFGMVGLLQEKGVVTDVGAPQPDDVRLIQYRRVSGALLSVAVPAATQLAPGDFLLVKTLTLPDGAVEPVAIRPPSSTGWIAIADVGAVVRRYTGGTGRFIRWSGATGAACGIAALCGIAAPVSAVAGIVAIGAAWRLHRRDRQDRARIEKLTD